MDPCYDNVEEYHASQDGLRLREILAVREVLTAPLLPEFQFVMAELFKL